MKLYVMEPGLLSVVGYQLLLADILPEALALYEFVSDILSELQLQYEKLLSDRLLGLQVELQA